MEHTDQQTGDLELKPVSGHKKKIPIIEIFGPTVQGEGILMGQPTMFIRTGLCDYKCERCDSLHAVNPDLVKQNAEWLTQAELVTKVAGAIKNTPLITLSGGNPCIHDMSDFLQANYSGQLGGQRRAIALETQGSKWTDWVTMCDFVTISPKGPGMGEKFEPEKFNVFYEMVCNNPNFKGHWCIKVPVFDQRDLELVIEIMDHWPSTRDHMFISTGNNNPPAPAKRNQGNTELTIDEFRHFVLQSYEHILNLVMNDKRLNGICVLPQLHTLIWGNERCR